MKKALSKEKELFHITNAAKVEMASGYLERH